MRNFWFGKGKDKKPELPQPKRNHLDLPEEIDQDAFNKETTKALRNYLANPSNDLELLMDGTALLINNAKYLSEKNWTDLSKSLPSERVKVIADFLNEKEAELNIGEGLNQICRALLKYLPNATIVVTSSANLEESSFKSHNNNKESR